MLLSECELDVGGIALGPEDRCLWAADDDRIAQTFAATRVSCPHGWGQQTRERMERGAMWEADLGGSCW